MQQAARVSEFTAFILTNGKSNRVGVLTEYGTIIQHFTNPDNKIAEEYISGRFG
jgi:phosphate transport system ATP-binding protein